MIQTALSDVTSALPHATHSFMHLCVPCYMHRSNKEHTKHERMRAYIRGVVQSICLMALIHLLWWDTVIQDTCMNGAAMLNVM